MIQLYPKGTEDFSRNGIELAPQESDVNWQIAARYDFSMSIPKEACEGITFDYGQILRVSVPPEHVDAINLGTVSYYTASEGTKLYSQLPKSVAVRKDSIKAHISFIVIIFSSSQGIRPRSLSRPCDAFHAPRSGNPRDLYRR